MQKLINILKGWARFLFLPRSKMAKERLEICFECQYRFGIVCSLCGCHLISKAELEEEDCPKGFWNKTPSQSPTS